MNANTGLSEYNGFCKDLRAGNILYNIDSTNMWGEYLLVAHVTSVMVGDKKTYTALLICMEKKDGSYLPLNRCISLTPDSAKNVPFLKHIGYCKFNLIPQFTDMKVDVGLVAVYSRTDLHKFATKLSIRKPKNRKYGNDGKLVIGKTENK